MQTYKGDISWWVREANNDSATATEIIKKLGNRTVVLQEENEILKAENIALKRAGNDKNLDELQKLKATISNLTDWLKEEGLNKRTIACITSEGKGLQIPYSLLSASNDFRLQLNSMDFDYPNHIFSTYRHTSLFILSATFQIFQDYTFAIPYSDDIRLNSPQTLTNLSFAEGKITVIREEQSLKGKSLVILVTSQGFVKRFMRKTFLDFLNTNHPIVTRPGDDRPVQIVMSSNKNLLLATKNGKWIKFPSKSVPVEGDYGLTLEKTDKVIGAVEVDDRANIFFVGTDGSVIAIQGSAFANTKKTGGKGRGLPKDIRPITCFASNRNPHIVWLTKQGKIGVTNLKVVPVAKKLKDAKRVNLIQQELLACSAILSGH